MTKRDTAVHTDALLGLLISIRKLQVKLLPVFNAFLWHAVGGKFALIFHKTSRFSHCHSPLNVPLHDGKQSFLLRSKAAMAASSPLSPDNYLFEYLHHTVIILGHDTRQTSAGFHPNGRVGVEQKRFGWRLYDAGAWSLTQSISAGSVSFCRLTIS